MIKDLLENQPKRIVMPVFISIIGIMLAAGVIAFQSIIATRDATTERARSREILMHLELLQRYLDEVESGQRGYLITNEDRYIEEFNESAQNLEGQLELLLGKTDDSHHIPSVKISVQIREKLEQLKSVVSAATNGERNQALALFGASEGHSLSSNIRDLILDAQKSENLRLESAMKRFDRVIARSITAVLVSTAVAISAIFLAMLWLTRELTRRRDSEIALRQHEDILIRESQRLTAIIATQQKVGLDDLNEASVMNKIVTDISEITGAIGAVVEMIDGSEIVYTAGSGPASTSLGLRIKMAGSFSGLAIATGESLYCSDSELDDRVNREACRKVGLRSMIVSPLVFGERKIGVLKVFSPNPHAFDDGDIASLRVMSGLLSASLAYAGEFEGKIKAERKAVEASRLKSEFLANMSHEIRTPLYGVLGMSDLLNETPLNAMQKDHLDSIQRSASALLGIVNDILDFSKIEAGKLEIEKTDFDLDQIISDVCKTASLSARNKGLKFKTEIPEDFLSVLCGDGGRVRQVLNNLLSNAVKFTNEGAVTLSIEHTDRTENGIRIRFSIKDSGIGIAEDALSRLFSPFIQADATTTRRFGGTGLGLSISKQLVESMGGELGVETELGNGSTFWFVLPFSYGSVQSRTFKVNFSEGIIPALQGKRILVAEDNSINQKIAAALLSRFGCKIVIVGNGRAALDALEAQTFDLVLMDCQMPEMDGYEATKVIRARNDALWQHIPIIAMTANAVKGDRERCLETGMNDYVSKPVNPALCAEAMLRCLAGVEDNASSHDPEIDGARPILDDDIFSALLEIQNSTGGSLIEELAIEYINTTPGRLTCIKDAISNNDRSKVEKETHGLKGAAGSIGLLRFADHCEKIELSVRDENFSALSDMHATLEKNFPETVQALNEAIKHHLKKSA